MMSPSTTDVNNQDRVPHRRGAAPAKVATIDDSRLIARDDFQIDTKRRKFCHRCSRVGLDRIGKNAEPDQCQIRLVLSGESALAYQQDFDGDSEEPVAFAIIVLLQRLDPLASGLIKWTGKTVHLRRHGTCQNRFRGAFCYQQGFVIARGRNG